MDLSKNPYAPPLATPEATQPGWFVSAGRLFAFNGARFPRICIISGEPVPDDANPVTATFQKGNNLVFLGLISLILIIPLTFATVAWFQKLNGLSQDGLLRRHTMELAVIVFLPILLAFIIGSVSCYRKQVRVSYFLAPELFNRRKKILWIQGIASAAAVLFCIGLDQFLPAWNAGRYMIYLMMLAWYPFARRLSRLQLNAAHHENNMVELTGFGPEFLEFLPSLPPPR